ncbi:MAG TPA: AbrB/MazE/SpoVT family DNA-binding domain-containing protein [Ignavibacteria bacterium]|nr:AbrB/MazE/SpoVT family DNA-binding domain-containing protein [Ignavibacteria bacterium]
MTTVTVSPKFQVVIPKEIRTKLKLKPGQKLQIIQIGDKLQFIPIIDIKKARGFLKGIDTDITREKDKL